MTLFICRLYIKFVVELPICSNASTKQAIIFLIDIDNSHRRVNPGSTSQFGPYIVSRIIISIDYNKDVVLVVVVVVG